MELQTLIDIVKEVSGLVVKSSSDFDIMEKDGVANIVTSSDIAVQKALISRLSALMPESLFLCEEEDVVCHEGKSSETSAVWIIDPIDGTANYARGIRECAISVGLRQNGQMELAVVYLPRTDECFSAQRGKGAWLNGSPIHVSSRNFANSIMCTAMCVYHKENAKVCSDIIMETYMQSNDVRRFGAAAPELCYLANGNIELYFEFCLSPWDYAASLLILSEAGGYISDLQGRPLDPTKPSGVLAANTKENLARLVEIVSHHIKAS